MIPQERIEYAFGDRAAAVAFRDGAQGVAVTVSFDGEQITPRNSSAPTGKPS